MSNKSYLIILALCIISFCFGKYSQPNKIIEKTQIEKSNSDKLNLSNNDKIEITEETKPDGTVSKKTTIQKNTVVSQEKTQIEKIKTEKIVINPPKNLLYLGSLTNLSERGNRMDKVGYMRLGGISWGVEVGRQVWQDRKDELFVGGNLGISF